MPRTVKLPSGTEVETVLVYTSEYGDKRVDEMSREELLGVISDLYDELQMYRDQESFGFVNKFKALTGMR